MPQYKAIMVFLLAMTIILGIYIFAQGLSSYQNSKQRTEETWNPAIECTRYIYSVSDISYANSVISFMFQNLDYSGSSVSNITIISDKNSTKTFQKMLPRGTYSSFETQFDVKDNFTIFPDSCAVFKKTCYLSTKECSGYEPPAYVE